MERTDILVFVVSAGVLDEYRSKDACLDKLVRIASESPGVWQTCLDITVTSPPPLPASHLERTFRRRLEGIPDEPSTEHIRAATAKLVDYCAIHPDVSIWGVGFNCPEHSYDVFCAQVDERLEAICVMVGKHVPEYALKGQDSPRHE